MRAAPAGTRRAWLAAAALAMGGGIWSMHFVGMLAFSLPGTEICYDLRLTLLSLVLPIAVTGPAFRRQPARRRRSPSASAASSWGSASPPCTIPAWRRCAWRPPQLRPLWVAHLDPHRDRRLGRRALARLSAHQRQVQRLAAGGHGLCVSGMHYAAMMGSCSALDDPDGHAGRHASVSQTLPRASGSPARPS